MKCPVSPVEKMNSDRVRIVRLEDPVEYRKAEQVQRNAWQTPPGESIIPFHTLIAAQYHSGLVLGAYNKKNQMVGCSFGISAYDKERKRPYHYSHITCVHQDYQNHGIGFLLKKEQRELLLREEYDLVKWTFDPLQAGNGHFNIRKLGVIAREYHRNLYGSMPDGLNIGMVSDRFETEWWINSPHVKERIRDRKSHSDHQSELDGSGERINQTELSKGLRMPLHIDLTLHADRLLFEIPRNIGEVKRKDPGFARKWTVHTRRSFEHYFGKGYTVTDVLADNENRVYYLLEQDFPLPKYRESGGRRIEH